MDGVEMMMVVVAVMKMMMIKILIFLPVFNCEVYNHFLLEEYLNLILSQLSTLHKRPSHDEFSVLRSDSSSPCWSNLLTKITSCIPNSTDCS